jgi:hypothetical protein
VGIGGVRSNPANSANITGANMRCADEERMT